MKKVRASLGTLGVLGLELIMMDVPPTTAYLQVYTEERCRANCLFCAQAAKAKADLKHIARGLYLPADLEKVIGRLKTAYERGYIKRVCIQTSLYKDIWEDTTYLLRKIREVSSIPISLSVFPLSNEKYQELKSLGVDHLVIPLDACTEELFEAIKGRGAGGPFRWKSHIDGLKRGARILGKGRVGTHLIIGMGEKDEEAIRLIDKLHDSGISTALFAYTYIEGTQRIPKQEKHAASEIFPRSKHHYRTVQLAHYLITNNLARYKEMTFHLGSLVDYGIGREALLKEIFRGKAFQTAGCPECNRPYATEVPGGEYNFPRPPTQTENQEIIQQLGILP
jgi:biotin synthase